MDDAFLVRGLERLGDLSRNPERLGDRQPRTLRPQPFEVFRQRLAIDQLHGEEARLARLFDAIDAGDVRVAERGEHLRFALETSHALGIVQEQIGKDLDGDVAAKPGVPRAIHLAHPARAEQGDDLVGAKRGSRSQGHLQILKSSSPQILR